MKEALRTEIEEALRALLDAAGDADPLPDFAIEVPRQKEHGDYSCNASMLLAKRLRQKPRDIAEDLKARLGDAGGIVANLEVAGPGFLNVKLAESGWQDLLHDIIEAGDRFGQSESAEVASAKAGDAKPKVQVEFVSANPTGPLSTGHGRQGILGDCIARLLEATGWDVTREYYFNDGGRQMRVLGDSVKARYLESLGLAAPPSREALEDPEKNWVDEVDGLPVAFPKDGYQGDYIADIAAGLRDAEGEGLVDEPGEGRFRDEAQRVIFEDIEATLKRIGIEFDVYYNERSLYDEGKLEEAITDLREAGLIYDADGATWFKATQRGLDTFITESLDVLAKRPQSVDEISEAKQNARKIQKECETKKLGFKKLEELSRLLALYSRAPIELRAVRVHGLLRRDRYRFEHILGDALEL